MAPLLMGDAARGLFTLPEISRMGDISSLEIKDVKAVGKDWRIVVKPKNG
jgi:diaminohydroxyphosphoribosylaminopyrimidine deaminase/5-amino-6-(5-phosphoribosylamino)uracil reductase